MAYSGLAAVCVFYLIVALAAPDSLGAADIRLAGLLGLALAWRDWTTLVTGTLLALLYASLTGAILIILRRASWVGDRTGSLSNRCAGSPRVSRYIPLLLTATGRDHRS